MEHSRRKVLRRQSSGALRGGALVCAIGHIVLGSVGTIALMPAGAWAQSAPVLAPVRSYSIPPGTLEDVLNRFGRESGILLSFTPQTTAGLRSNGLQDSYSVQAGLEMLLAGTGLRATRQANGSYLLSPLTTTDGSELPLVTVQGGSNMTETATGPVNGYIATRSATGTKTDTPLIETPRSISIVTAKQIEYQAAQSVNEALRYTVGVRNDYYGPSTFQDQMMIRGFTTDTYVDGIAVIDGDGGYDTQANPLTVERIEVLRGPSSALYGQSRPGGMVNLVSKRPTEKTTRRVQLQTGSYDRLQGTFDLSGPITDDGKLLYRLAGGARISGTDVDQVDDDRYFIEGGLTWRPKNGTEWTLLGKYRKDKAGPLQHDLPVVGTRIHSDLGQIPTSLFVGEPAWNSYDRNTASITSLFSHKINDVLTFKQNMRVTHNDIDMKDIAISSYLGNGIVDRYASLLHRTKTSFGADQHLEADFSTGALEHKLLMGIDYRYSQLINGGGFEYLDGTFDLYHPVYGAAIPNVPFNTVTSEKLHQWGVYAQDQIKVDGFILNLGLRQDWSDMEQFDRSTRESVNQKDKALTWNAGVGYLFNSGAMPYASYTQSFEPQMGSGWDGEVFKPTKGEQYEVGLKYQPKDTNLLLTTSVYHLEQENVTTTDVNHQCANWSDPRCGYYSEQTGMVRSKGLELEARWHTTRALELIAAYSYIDTKTVRTNTLANLGKEIRFIPHHQASAWANYHLQNGPLAGLGMGGGVRYIGPSYGNSSNTIENDRYVLADAVLSYDFSKKWKELTGLRLSVNVTNLLDKVYVSTCTSLSTASAGCYYGSRRKVLATLTYEW